MKLITYMSTGLFMLLSAFIMKKDNGQQQSLYETKWSLKKIHTKQGTEEVNTKAFIKFNQQKQSAGGNGNGADIGHRSLEGWGDRLLGVKQAGLPNEPSCKDC